MYKQKFAHNQKGYYSYLTIGYDKKKLRLSPQIVITYTVSTLRIFIVRTTWHSINNIWHIWWTNIVPIRTIIVRNKQINFSPSSSLSALKSLNSDHFAIIAKLESILTVQGHKSITERLESKTSKYNSIAQGLLNKFNYTGSGIITNKIQEKVTSK